MPQGFLLIVLVVSIVVLVVLNTFPITDLTFDLRDWMNLAFMMVAVASLYYARRSNRRADRVFHGQIRPLIQVRPMGLVERPERNGVDTVFSVVNYSGFDAYNISIDLQYGDKEWISEWLYAYEDNLKRQKGTYEAEEGLYGFYPTTPRPKIKELKAGETANQVKVTGRTFDLEVDVCGKGGKGTAVSVRSIWENGDGYRFDRVDRYQLICTSVNEGRSFSLLPLGERVSQNTSPV
jgi:hypothetical protein